MTPDEWAAYRAERAREDARDAIAQGVATPAEHALIGCRCESCIAAVEATLHFLAERTAERVKAAQALRDSVTEAYFVASLSEDDKLWLRDVAGVAL